MKQGLDGSAGELVELVDQGNVLTGELVPRSVAHAQGLLHRTVYVLLTDAAGEQVVLQQRHSQKAVCPTLWDLTVAEHVAPGESYHEAACRGIREELGVMNLPELRELLPPTRRELRWTTASGKRIHDVEFVPVWTGVLAHDAELHPDGVEVAAWRWTPWCEVIREAASLPSSFTPWFLETLRLLGKVPQEDSA
jgi:isopentenyl-diphosphate Delta-isomerase